MQEGARGVRDVAWDGGERSIARGLIPSVPGS